MKGHLRVTEEHVRCVVGVVRGARCVVGVVRGDINILH